MGQTSSGSSTEVLGENPCQADRDREARHAPVKQEACALGKGSIPSQQPSAESLDFCGGGRLFAGSLRVLDQRFRLAERSPVGNGVPFLRNEFIPREDGPFP
ncbi:MAG: hypothetical protein CL933_01180 [Deltaproteobacteria bacterium]|nr:hypothetical protein [Deltaproteobacteria bacterium]